MKTVLSRTISHAVQQVLTLYRMVKESSNAIQTSTSAANVVLFDLVSL